MLREPKTDRPLALALIGSVYSTIAIARDGNTLDPMAYRYISEIVGNERNFLLVAILVMFLQAIALFARGSVRLACCLAVTFVAAVFGIDVMRAAPNALLPGFALVVLSCNGLALFDVLRLRWHP